MKLYGNMSIKNNTLYIVVLCNKKFLHNTMKNCLTFKIIRYII